MNTLEQTVRGLPDVVDIRILVDDSSKDRTAALAKQLLWSRIVPLRARMTSTTSRILQKWLRASCDRRRSISQTAI